MGDRFRTEYGCQSALEPFDWLYEFYAVGGGIVHSGAYRERWSECSAYDSGRHDDRGSLPNTDSHSNAFGYKHADTRANKYNHTISNNHTDTDGNSGSSIDVNKYSDINRNANGGVHLYKYSNSHIDFHTNPNTHSQQIHQRQHRSSSSVISSSRQMAILRDGASNAVSPFPLRPLKEDV